MKNIDRLTKFITKNGSESILIHTIPGSQNWIICQKIEKDKWLLTLGAPLGNVTYNLGTATDDQHFEIWNMLMNIEIENKISQLLIAKDLRERIKYFKKSYEQTYKKFIKIEKMETKKINKNRFNKHKIKSIPKLK